MATSPAVKLANKASSVRLASLVSTAYDLPSGGCRLKVLHAGEVTKNQRKLIWSIFEANMQSLYTNSSFGWDPDSKRQELFHTLARFILVYGDEEVLSAFCAFRFEVEDEEDVLYLYDIQVTSSMQGRGLGKRLISELEKLCKEYHIEKVMLTVLKSNARAAALYKSIGFDIDPTSPGYVEEGHDLDKEQDVEDDGADYIILSKVIEDTP